MEKFPDGNVGLSPVVYNQNGRSLRYNNTEYRLTADYDWCIQCLRRSKRIHNTRLTLSNFLEEGLSSVNRKASLKERYEVMCKYYGKVSTILLHGWFAVRFYFAKWFKGRV